MKAIVSGGSSGLLEAFECVALKDSEPTEACSTYIIGNRLLDKWLGLTISYSNGR